MLQPATSALPTNQAPTAGVKTLSEKTYDIFALPPNFTVTTTSASGANAVSKTQYLFNNTTLNALVTDNGSGAGSITTSYGDGFSGRVYDAIAASQNGGRGVLIQGFTIQSTTNSTGAQNSAALNTIAFQILNANAQGGTFNIPLDVNSAISNAQYQVGILTIRQNFWLNTVNQISVILPVNTAFAFTFFTQTGNL